MIPIIHLLMLVFSRASLVEYLAVQCWSLRGLFCCFGVVQPPNLAVLATVTLGPAVLRALNVSGTSRPTCTPAQVPSLFLRLLKQRQAVRAALRALDLLPCCCGTSRARHPTFNFQPIQHPTPANVPSCFHFTTTTKRWNSTRLHPILCTHPRPSRNRRTGTFDTPRIRGV